MVFFRLLLSAAAFASAIGSARAYTLIGAKWPGATTTLQLQLGATNGPLLDGSASWGASAEDALNIWNSILGTLKFEVVRDSSATRVGNNRINNVFFSADMYGKAWGEGVLAVTLISSSRTSTVETDVLFNNRLSWNSYRGALRFSATGGAIYDFRRVAMHEFGHVLGLDHPDEDGQRVTALMNSHVSSLDTLASDDIAGAQSLYGAALITPPVITPQPPPVITPQPQPVTAPPQITVAAADKTVGAGQTLMLSVTATGTPPPSYQWMKGGIDIAGATSANFIIASASPSDAGVYSVRVTNALGSVTSVGAVVSVKFSRLANLSTRGLVPSGSALTPGFTVRGPGTKSLVIRAVGPTLSLFGITTALTATTLDVMAPDSTVVGSNKNWGGTLALNTEFSRVGAFPLAADSKDAALQTRLTAQAYTVRVSPAEPGASGVTLAEIYDADPATTSARLINLSTLGFVGAGDDVLTAGFVIAGDAPKRLLIRGVGPGLAPFGVGNRLVDPQLSLVPLGGLPLATNDDWPTLMSVQSAFVAAGAFSLPLGSKDAALVISLEPGGYTVVVSGVGATTGNALVEIYDLDP
jgi:hypothetical protein